MENASKALIIAGAILLSILIIAIGMFIYTSSQSTIQDSLTQMSTQEIEAFNSQFTIYGGKQTGAKLKSLMGTLIANANTYREEPAKLPWVKAGKLDSTGSYKNNTPAVTKGGCESELNAYVNALGYIRNHLEGKHTYTVVFSYSNNGVLTGIDVWYGTTNNPEAN